MNDIWNMLGIEKSSDKKVIRRAFAAQSKLHHPEEEPEYFAALNQAYKEALAYAAGTVRTGAAGYERNAGNIENAEKSAPSLLDKLQSAEAQRIRESMDSGALRDFISLFENPKQNKLADTWKRYFLTESFLGEQFREAFGKGLLEYLKSQDVWPADNLPGGLLQELAIAYAFIPHFAGEEYFEGKKYPKEWYKVSAENDTFQARKYAAEIFNMQGVECDLKSMTNHILRQPALKCRHNAFTDYLLLKEKNRNGQLTESESKNWQPVLRLAKLHHLYERNGKAAYDADGEARGECLIKLYVQWFKDERIPECVMKFLYRELALKELERSSTRGLYGALKEQILKQCPGLEELLFGGESREQMITKLHKACVRILNDNQSNYEKSVYEETPEIRQRVSAFFAMPEWEKLKDDRALFDKLYSVLRRLVMPRSMAEYLAAHFEKGDFPEPERSRLTASLVRSLSTEKMCREFDYRCQVSFENTDIADIGGDNEEFWQYYFFRGFGYRHVRTGSSPEEETDYELDGEAYLPAYIQYMYAPSKTWQKRFTGFDEKHGGIENPVSAVCLLPDGKALRVEFHYHYCLYFLENKEVFPTIPGQITKPVFSFRELCGYAEKLERAEHFFFLLAVTAIEEGDRKEAEALVEKWLERVPVHGFTRPLLARMLAADNDRVLLPADDAGRPESGPGDAVNSLLSRYCGKNSQFVSGDAETPFSGMDDAGNSWQAKTDDAGNSWQAKTDAGGNLWQTKTDDARNMRPSTAVYYMEGERFCFRAVVSETAVRIFRQVDYSWEDKIFRDKEFGWKECTLPGPLQKKLTNLPGVDFEGRKQAAREILEALKQPLPVCSASYSLEGMDVRQKAAAILKAMNLEINPEGYCVLRYGEKQEKRHTRVFYGAIAPFGFSLKEHSPEHVRSLNYNLSVSQTKIKEKKWLIGRFGWGFQYTTKSNFGPNSVWLGESGTYYTCGAIRTYRADNLADLLAQLYRDELEGVTAAEVYEGCLTVSRLDHRLEYCYGEADFLQSAESAETTIADYFTVFGRFPLWRQFVQWLDGGLEKGLPEWVNVILIMLDGENRDSLAFAGIHYVEEEAEEWGDEDESEAAEFGYMGEVGDREEVNEGEEGTGEDSKNETGAREFDNEDRVGAGEGGREKETGAGEFDNENGVGAAERSNEKGTGAREFENGSGIAVGEGGSGNETGAGEYVNEDDDRAVDSDAESGAWNRDNREAAEYNEGGKAGENQAEYEVYRPQAELLIWEKGSDIRDREASLYEAVNWYMNCGTYAEALKNRGIQLVMEPVRNF
ncbi:MAG TPA: hypothetical protein DCZ91_24665 [Lachnospiraceae bacterium]|nr:hypothetical protein [Lachnospiraceae bacterium]